MLLPIGPGILCLASKMNWGSSNQKSGGSMAKILYVGTHGTDDPTAATFPFLMAKGAIDAGHETGIILMGEAAPLIKDSIAAQIQGGGVPPLKALAGFLPGEQA